MWSLLGLLGIGAYAAGKQIKYNHDMKKRREEVANDPYVERDFVFVPGTLRPVSISSPSISRATESQSLR